MGALIEASGRLWLERHGGFTSSNKKQLCPIFLPKEKLSRPSGLDAEAFRSTDQDMLVLRQSVERVMPLLQMYGYLSKAVSIASTGRCSWVVVARRDPLAWITKARYIQTLMNSCYDNPPVSHGASGQPLARFVRARADQLVPN